MKAVSNTNETVNDYVESGIVCWYLLIFCKKLQNNEVMSELWISILSIVLRAGITQYVTHGAAWRICSQFRIISDTCLKKSIFDNFYML